LVDLSAGADRGSRSGGAEGAAEGPARDRALSRDLSRRAQALGGRAQRQAQQAHARARDDGTGDRAGGRRHRPRRARRRGCPPARDRGTSPPRRAKTALESIERGPKVVELHPAAVARYLSTVADLADVVARRAVDGGEEIAQALRELVAAIVIHPEGRKEPRIEVTGRLAKLIGADVFPQSSVEDVGSGDRNRTGDLRIMIPCALELSGPCPKRPSLESPARLPGREPPAESRCSSSDSTLRSTLCPLRGCYRKATAHSIRSRARRMFFAGRRSCARPASQSSDPPGQQEPKIQRPKSKSRCRIWLQTRRLIDRCRPYGSENDRRSDQTSLDGHTPASRISPYFPALFTAQIGPRHCGEISNPFHRCANITAKARENC
jgi:hypothetical protein